MGESKNVELFGKSEKILKNFTVYAIIWRFMR